MRTHRIARLLRPASLVLLMVCVYLMTSYGTASAGSGDLTNCTQPLNMSQSDGFVSADPFLLADSAGSVHLFWAERLTGEAGAIPNVPDTLMYSQWQQGEWSKPNDIFISPPSNVNKRINGIRGRVDEQGFIHLIWIGPDSTFFYSAARADAAGSARAWRPSLLIDDAQTGTQYSADIAITPQTSHTQTSDAQTSDAQASHTQAIHIVYGRSQGGVNRTIAYVRSVDRGVTWSEPVDIYTFLDFKRGASNLRLHTDGPDKLYATWTEWDTSGNGQAIYFARSLDNGLHWEPPVLLDTREGDEYERDWVNLAVLGENHLLVFWEGGVRAYPQAQYSEDGGVTWSEPIDTLFWLIADNGYAEFVRDSRERLHLFIARRIREGFTDKCTGFNGCSGEGNAIWHSIWESGPNWREPKPVESTFSPVNFISAAITGGNLVTLAWFSYDDLEVRTIQCQIEDAPALPLVPLTTVTPTPTALSADRRAISPTLSNSPVLTPTSIPNTVAPTVTVKPLNPNVQTSAATGQGIVLASFLPAFAVVLLILVINRRRQNY